MGSVRAFALSVTLVLVAALVGLPAGTAGGDASDGEAGWHRVEFVDRITAADRAALDAAGAETVQYVPDDAYLAWLDERAVARAGTLETVAAVARLEPADKVDPNLDRAVAPGRFVVTVHADQLASALETLEARWEVALHRPAQPDGALVNVYLSAPREAAELIAALPEVVYVGPTSGGPGRLGEISKQLVAGNHEPPAKPEPGYEDWLDEVGLDGSGVRVSIVDTGIDPHPDFGDRIAARVEYSRTVTEPFDVGHGTHVAGTVGGNPTDVPGIGRVTDDDGFLYGSGVAPAVELVDQNALAVTASAVVCNVLWPPPDYGWEQLTEDALDHGAVMYNASWWTCEAVGGGYIESARTFDILARNADWRTDEFEPFTFVFSAGNSGDSEDPDEPRVTSPTEAKNLISVAASTNWRGGTGTQLAGFSSRGPAVDGRVVPTVTAPGQHIVSQRAFTATAVCGIPPGDDRFRGFGLYGSCSGTSMAAPHVSGAVALTTEWWRGLHDGADPSPAAARALLVNTAEPLRPDERAIPNRHEGWGIINLGNLFDPSVEWVHLDEDVILEDVGEEHTIAVRPADSDRPLRISLAWSDAPAAAGADPALVNDLDLRVEAPDGTVYRGNVLEGSWSVPGGERDRLNNIESVFLEEPSDGTYTITVRAHNLPGDGVPANPAATDQDFALVVWNGEEVVE